MPRSRHTDSKKAKADKAKADKDFKKYLKSILERWSVDDHNIHVEYGYVSYCVDNFVNHVPTGKATLTIHARLSAKGKRKCAKKVSSGSRGKSRAKSAGRRTGAQG